MRFFERRTVPLGSNSQNQLVAPASISRVNACSLPLNGFHLTGWVVYAFMAVVAFGIYVPMLPPPWTSLAYSVLGLAHLSHVVTRVACEAIDPADPSVRAKSYSSPVLILDRKKHPHAIHNLHCYLCDVDVGCKVKHCSSCNKCIADFDHHCKWLNNCVGGRNYWLFLMAVISATVGQLLLLIVILYVVIEHFVNPANLRTAPQYQSVHSNSTWLAFLPLAPVKVTSISILVLAFVTTLLTLVSLLLLGHLVGFHIYLLRKELSTYDYVVLQRQSQGARTTQLKSSTGDPQYDTQSVETSVDCDPVLSNKMSVFKFQNSHLSEAFCTDVEGVKSASEESDSKSAIQSLSGRAVRTPAREQSMMGYVDVTPVVQSQLGSPSTSSHQQLFSLPRHSRSDTR